MADPGAASGWLQAASIVGPVAGVVVGALLARGLSRHTFTREFAMSTIEQRRLTYTAFRKALWAYGGRTYFLQNLLREALERGKRPPTPGRNVEVVYDHAETRARQEACRDAYADLVLWASPQVSQAGWEAYEALSRAVNAALPPAVDLPQAEAEYRRYEEHHVALSNAINADVRDMNLAIYERTTPWWRRLGRRIARRPHPFDIVPTPSGTVSIEGMPDHDSGDGPFASVKVEDRLSEPSTAPSSPAASRTRDGWKPRP